MSKTLPLQDFFFFFFFTKNLGVMSVAPVLALSNSCTLCKPLNISRNGSHYH